MKTFLKSLVVMGAGISLMAVTACNNQSSTVALKTSMDSASYAIGLDIGKSIQRSDADVDLNILLAGMKDGVAIGQALAKNDTTKKALLTEAQAQQVMMNFQTAMQQKQMQKAQKQGDENKKQGDAYLAKYKQEAGVTAMPDGILYKVIGSGSGASPTDQSTVTVHYEGRLVDGKVFDSSYQRNEPVTFPLANVIPGWRSILPKMKVGDTWEVVIPSELAYGPQGQGAVIGPNAVLIFKIELKEVK
jgi:FKBP-type peptidyl-prolyl cis-trans isomerase